MESHQLEERLNQLEEQSRTITSKLIELSIVLQQVGVELKRITLVEERMKKLYPKDKPPANLID